MNFHDVSTRIPHHVTHLRFLFWLSSKLWFPHKIRNGQPAITRVEPHRPRLPLHTAHPMPCAVAPVPPHRRVHESHNVLDGVPIPPRPLGRVGVEGVDLDAPQVRVLAVLVVLEYLHLQDVRHERVAVRVAACAGKRHLLPADGALEGDGGEFDEVVFAGA